MNASELSDSKHRKKAAFYSFFDKSTTKMSRTRKNNMTKNWLVEFITLCADVETASCSDGVEQLRDIAWELLSKGRKGELEKENFQEIDVEEEEIGVESDSDDGDEEEEGEDGAHDEGEGDFLVRLHPVATKSIARLDKVTSKIHTYSTVTLKKGVEDLNKAEIELAFLEELAGVGDFKRFSTVTGIKIGTRESIDLADVTVMKIGGVNGKLKVLDETLSSEEVLAMFCPYDISTRRSSTYFTHRSVSIVSLMNSHAARTNPSELQAAMRVPLCVLPNKS